MVSISRPNHNRSSGPNALIDRPSVGRRPSSWSNDFERKRFAKPMELRARGLVCGTVGTTVAAVFGQKMMGKVRAKVRVTKPSGPAAAGSDRRDSRLLAD